MPDGLLVMGAPLVIGRAIEQFAPSLDVSMPEGLLGQPASTVATMGLGLLTAGYAINEIVIKKRPLATNNIGAFLLGGTLLSGTVIKTLSGYMPTPAAARVVVKPTRVAARVPARAKPKLY